MRGECLWWGSGDFFWLWRKVLKSDKRQMPWECWRLNSSLAWPCLPFPLVYRIIFNPIILRSWHHNVKQLSCLVNTIVFWGISTGICYLGRTWIFRGSLCWWALTAGEPPLGWHFCTNSFPPPSPLLHEPATHWELTMICRFLARFISKRISLSSYLGLQ